MKFTVYYNNKDNKVFWLSEDNSIQVWSPYTCGGNRNWIVEGILKQVVFPNQVKVLIYLAAWLGDVTFEYENMSQETPTKRLTSSIKSPVRTRKMQLE